MLRDYLKLHLCSATGIQTAGLVLTLNGEPVTIHARVKHLLSDGDGLRTGLQWMGQGCSKPCWRHWNVLRKNSDRAHRSAGNEYVEIDCHEHHRFQVWRQSDLTDAVAVILEARRQADAGLATRARLERVEQAFGFRATEHGLLADEELRRCFNVVDVVRYDWVHTFLQSGAVTIDTWGLIDA